MQLQHYKQVLREWQDAQSPPRPHDLFIKKSEARKLLRAAQCQESARRRDNLLEDINKAHGSNQKLFFQLVKSHKIGEPNRMTIQVGDSMAEST